MYCLSWSWRKVHGESTDGTCPSCSWCFVRIGMWPKTGWFPLEIHHKKKLGGVRPAKSVISLNQHLQPRHIGAIPSTAFTYTALVDVSDLQVCRESLQPWQKLRECDRSFLWWNLLSKWTYSWNTQCISMSVWLYPHCFRVMVMVVSTSQKYQMLQQELVSGSFKTKSRYSNKLFRMIKWWNHFRWITLGSARSTLEYKKILYIVSLSVLDIQCFELKIMVPVYDLFYLLYVDPYIPCDLSDVWYSSILHRHWQKLCQVTSHWPVASAPMWSMHTFAVLTGREWHHQSPGGVMKNGLILAKGTCDLTPPMLPSRNNNLKLSLKPISWLQITNWTKIVGCHFPKKGSWSFSFPMCQATIA